MRREFGDFQTPRALVDMILEVLGPVGAKWTRVLEPTCGTGSFIQGLVESALPPQEIVGLELQDSHLAVARGIQSSGSNIKLYKADIFSVQLEADIKWSSNGPLLVIGNPPWVTNSEQGSLGSTNLPTKRNIKGFKGMDAVTGKSNFDIAEYIWIKVVNELRYEELTVAMLCKTTVARNVLKYCYDVGLPVTDASLYRIDAKMWFGAIVDACLFRITMSAGGKTYVAPVYADLHDKKPQNTMGVFGGRLVADMTTYEKIATIDHVSPMTWRQGVKHDASSVMELEITENNTVNGFGEQVDVEKEYLYPLLKSSDLASERSYLNHRLLVIIPQKSLGEETRRLAIVAPRLWEYLLKHKPVFDRRKSSIYKGKPPFSIFGIGEYTFAPYKVAISGMYKSARFRLVGPIDRMPVIVDDTCYFLACSSPEQACLVWTLLTDSLCDDLVSSVMFPDSKRPVTKQLLQRIDLNRILSLSDWGQAVQRYVSAWQELMPGIGASLISRDDASMLLTDNPSGVQQRLLMA